MAPAATTAVTTAATTAMTPAMNPQAAPASDRTTAAVHLASVRPDPVSGLRLLVCDDHRVFADALAAYLDALPEIADVTVTYTADQVLYELGRCAVDILLLDLSLRGDEEVLAVLEAVRHRGWDGRVLIISGTTDAALIARALDRGADGFISKDVGPAALLTCILRIAAGQVELPSEVVRDVVHELRRLRERTCRSERLRARLSPREEQTLRLLAVGKNTREIAAELQVSVNTTRTHLAHIRSKLGVHSQLEASARGREIFADRLP